VQETWAGTPEQRWQLASTRPSGWTAQDIGGPGVPGSSSYDATSGTWTVAGGGADIWHTSDQFRFTYQSFTGDGAITARVAAVGNTGPYAKAGVMIRESLAANSRHALVDVTPSHGIEFIRRTATGANAVSNFDSGVAAPYWVRLVRQGNTFAAYDSPDGTNWHTVGSDVIPMGGTVYAGLAVCAFNDAALDTATFTNLSVLPGGWTAGDIGGPGRPGSSLYDPAAGTWTVAGSGADIAGLADQFQFVSQGFPGDGSLTARVTSVQNTDPWAKAGVMFRASADPGAVFADVMATPGNGVIFQWRDTPGGPTDKFQVTGLHAPVWVQLVRAGNAFRGYYSTDGVNWIQIGSSHTVVMSATALVGLPVSSHNNGVVNTATFDNLSINALTPAHIQFTNPSTVMAGTPFPITVTVQDAYGNTVTGYTGTVHFTASNGAMANYTFTPADLGTHIFTLTLTRAAALTVTGTDTGGTGATGMTSFTVTPAAADHLVFLQPPSDTAAGQTISPPVVVAVVDQYGNVETGDNSDVVTLSLSTNPGGGTLHGTLTMTVINGQANFADLSIDQAGMGYTLHATSSGSLPDIDSGLFNIT
jgi:regulation of enolase protein 1 (concanavalin A-like superfamily)